MKTIYLLAISSLITFYTQAQKQILYYTDKWEITPREQATFYRVCNYNSANLFFAGEVRDYTLDSTLVMRGSYSNYGTKDGEFIFFYPSGKLQAQGNFKKDVRDGIWKFYFENGNLNREIDFSNDTFSPITVIDVTGNKVINNGTGVWNFEYEWYKQEATYIIQGQFVTGKKEGAWTCKLSSGDLLYREVYKNGIFKSGSLYDPIRRSITTPIENKFMLPYKFEVTEKFIPTINAKRYHYPLLNFLPGPNPDSIKQAPHSPSKIDTSNHDVYSYAEIPAQFPGGEEALKKFIATNIKYPADAKRNGQQGKVYIKFIVETDGTITNIDILKSVDRFLNLEAVRIVSSFPKWIPAKQNGKIVRSQHVLPIIFTLGR